jgi:polyisoprenyl-teichoic acid--peptidoglycan teichoic acid transferase
MSAARSGPRAWFRTYVIALVITLALTVGGLAGVNALIDRKIANIERVPNLVFNDDTEPAEPANFLLIGSDTRAFVDTAEEEESFGDETDAGGQRSDTLMIVHVDPENRKGLLVSFPRDLLVEIPGLGEEKINTAFNEGPQRVIDTIQSNFDIPIHHYLEIDFASFKGIVDAVGGVPVFFDAPAATYPGCFELDGEQALAYVRSRSYERNIDGVWRTDPTADIGRIDRQQAFMRRLAAEAVAKSLSNPLGANNIANESLSELRADEGLSTGDVKKLIQAFRRVDPNDPTSIEMVTVPFTEAGNGADLVLDDDAAAPLFARLRELATPPPAPDGPAPSSIRVRVLNGSGVSGAAADTEAALGDHGFQPGGVGNNPDGDVDSTEIRYRPDAQDKAEVVQSLLAGGVGELVADDSIVEADVVLILGEDFEGIVAPTGAAPPESTAAPAPAPSSASPPAEGTSEENTGPDQTDCG